MNRFWKAALGGGRPFIHHGGKFYESTEDFTVAEFHAFDVGTLT